MSDTTQNDSQEGAPAETTSATIDAKNEAKEPSDSKATADDSKTSPAPKAPKQSKQSKGLTWLTLLIALTAVLGSSYLYWQQSKSGQVDASSNAEIQLLDQNLRETQAQLNNLESRLAALNNAQTESQQAAAALNTSIELRQSALDSLLSRSSSMEAAIANIQGISKGSRSNWLLAEAQYYMQIANAQLQLVGNPATASLALKLADERLHDLGDPAYTNVRRALSDEIQTLETISKVDIEGISLTLASLSRVAESLPIREQVDRTEAANTPTNLDNLSGLDRAGAAVKNALQSVVSVRRSDEKARPLISPDAKQFLRANLSLQMQAARLALLRGEKGIFQQSLDDASTWLRDYYATDDAAVVGALQTLDEIRNQQVDVATPDISESLRLLRQQRTLTGSAQ